MKMISKVTLLLAGVLSVTFVINFVVLNTTVMSSFAALERDTAMQNARRVKQAIERELGFLQGIGRDWASWTDTREYALGRQPAYVAQNLMPASLVGLKTNSLFLIDKDANVLWGLSLDLETEEPITIAELPAYRGWKSHPLLQQTDADKDSIFTGLMKTDHGIMAVVSAPILDSEARGPAAGTLVWGKLLNDAVLKLLAQQTGVVFELIEPNAAGLPEAIDGSDDPVVMESSDAVLNGFHVLRDTAGNAISVIKSETPRDITRNGTRTLVTALVLLVLAGLAVMAAVAFGLRMIALKPLTHLTDTVVAIARTGDLKSRSGMSRDDEIGVLSKHFDEMLDELAIAREAIREQSYYTGILEMSAGLMHNLRNSLNPVTTGIWSALEILRHNRLENFSRAIKELSELQVDSERRSKLFIFVGQVAQQITEERILLKDKITQLETETKAISEILDQQNKLNRPELCIEAVSVRDVIDSAVKLLPMNKGILLDVACPDDAAPVAGNHILLSQVVGNILVNAAEAIDATGRGQGTIKLLVSYEGEPAAPFARITIKDDGDGIAPDVLPKIFQRGFSTRKQASGGLGLHWCANTTTAMGGNLTIESDGVGQGAMVRVDLKLAAGQTRSEAA
jgi:signal transduction histidine kinase